MCPQLRIEGGISAFEGETAYVLPQEIQYEDYSSWKVQHVTFRRWPRDPQRNPINLGVPLVFINLDSLPAIKGGGYVHEMFEVGNGLRCKVREREHIPRFILADMRKSVDGDLRFEHLDMPPGVTPRKYKGGRTDGNFLVGRVKRVRGG